MNRVEAELRDRLPGGWEEMPVEHLWEQLHQVVSSEAGSSSVGKGDRPKVQAPEELRQEQLRALEHWRELRAEYAGRMGMPRGGEMTMVIRAWQVAAQLTKATRVVKQAKRKEYQAVRKQLEEQLGETWEKRNMAECWRLARRLAGTRCGNKRRKLNVPQRCRPDVGEWRRALAAPEGAGGYSATFYVDRDSMLQGIGRRAGAERHANVPPCRGRDTHGEDREADP